MTNPKDLKEKDRVYFVAKGTYGEPVDCGEGTVYGFDIENKTRMVWVIRKGNCEMLAVPLKDITKL